MDANQLKDYVGQRLDKIEQKLDNHLERVSKAETTLEHTQGSIKLIFSILLAGISAAVTAAIHYITGGIVK